MCVQKSIIIVIVLMAVLIQYILATYCLIRLYKYEPKYFNTIIWNIIILFIVLVGPIAYLILDKNNTKESKFLNKQLGITTKVDDETDKDIS